jgi:UDP-glucuronate 4-epimerase
VRVLVTGAAGFIGFHVSLALLARGDEVVALDNINDYYDVRLKEARLRQLQAHDAFDFVRGDVADASVVAGVFDRTPQRVVHLAAQVGVRYSISRPETYPASNMVGFLNILEGCRRVNVEHLVFASSSSVYGANTAMPFSVHQNADHPLSLYGATKKANELMAHSYSHLYDLPCTGLRLFTVYGPWGRPDMAPFRFTSAIAAGRPIDLFNRGNMRRDFTYIDDVVDAVLAVLVRTPAANPHWSGDAPDPATSHAPYAIYNVGNNAMVSLRDFVSAIERALGKKADINLLPMQPGDVPSTYADIEDLARDVGYDPRTSVEEGVARFVAWYCDFYGLPPRKLTSSVVRAEADHVV